MSRFIALLCAATLAVSASAVFAADTDTTADDSDATATATATEAADATEAPESTEDAAATEEAEATEEATAVPSFVDVPEDAYYAEAVAYCAAAGLFNGTSDNEFSPSLTMTRGMFATVFGRLENADLTADYELTYQDVKADAYYAPYIAWATEQGIMDGYSDEEFGPDDAITREQAAKMIYAYMTKVAGSDLTVEADATYADMASVSDWALDAINYNTVAGYLLADEDGNINPTAELIRADACYAVAAALKALEPEATATPAATEDADATATPAATADADATATPAATADADATATPAATEDAEATATPAATVAPTATPAA